LSNRTGRTSSKEQYAFLYRADRVAWTGVNYTYDDVNDVFEREPFVAGFRSGSRDFLMVDIHTKPYDNTISEIAALGIVADDAQNRTGEDDIIILGDFNADCAYTDETKLDVALPGFFWIVNNSEDTTVGTSDCTYDRIIYEGEVGYEGQHGVLHFDENMTRDAALNVSDHYPVWAELTT